MRAWVQATRALAAIPSRLGHGGRRALRRRRDRLAAAAAGDVEVTDPAQARGVPRRAPVRVCVQISVRPAGFQP